MRTITCCCVLALLTGHPATVAAQLGGPFHAASVRASALANRCGGEPHADDPFLERVSALVWAAEPTRMSELDELVAEAQAAAVAAPGSAAAQYDLAAVLGVRTDFAEGRARLAAAEEVLAQALEVLEIDPSHPGAHHVLGRLNAGAMRMGRLDRFLARTFLGSEMLDEASWSLARHQLEVAEAGDPCVPEHHYELARLYLERGASALAYREIGHVLELTALDPTRWGTVRQEVVRMAEGM